MSEFKFVILVGPCLTTAFAAAGLFVAWRYLSRAPYVLAWSAAFAIMAFAILFRVLLTRADGTTSLFAAMIVQLLGTGTTAFLAFGFWSRAGKGSFLASTVLWVVAAVVTILLYLPVMPFRAGYVWGASVQAGALLWSAAIMSRGRRSTGLAEALARLVLIIVGLLRFSTALIAVAAMLGSEVAASHNWVPALMIEPAAVSMLAMFLIASDLSFDLNRLASTDPLTGIMNRAGFEDAANRALRAASARSRPLTVAIADIDRFKTINDRYGHAAGDAALGSFARWLADAVGDAGIVGRIGGEEFAVVLPHHNAAQAFAAIERVRTLTEAAAVTGHDGVRLTASFGIAQAEQGEFLGSLLARADDALYRSKNEGRNRSSLAASGSGAE